MTSFSKVAKLENGQFGAKIEIHKNMRKTTLQPHYSCSMQKSDQKTSQSLRNDKVFQSGKIGHLAKAIGFEK